MGCIVVCLLPLAMFLACAFVLPHACMQGYFHTSQREGYLPSFKALATHGAGVQLGLSELGALDKTVSASGSMGSTRSMGNAGLCRFWAGTQQAAGI